MMKHDPLLLLEKAKQTTNKADCNLPDFER